MHNLEYFIFCGCFWLFFCFFLKSQNHKPVIDECEQCMYSESRVIVA